MVKQALPTRKDWEDLLHEEGCKGGMMAETCTWQEMREEHISIANELPLPPKDMNQIMQAREDVKNWRNMSSSAKKGKLSLKTHCLLNFWLPYLPPIIYKDLLNRLFNPCQTQYPQALTQTMVSLFTLYLHLLSLLLKVGRCFTRSCINPPNSPILTPRTHSLNSIHKFITQDAPH